MPRIDPSIVCHHLAINPGIKPVAQRKRKLADTRLISEIKYPTWLANTILVKKANGKWRMCVDYTYLNIVYPKDLYPLPNIDYLIDNASGFKTLNFTDAYSGYNQIKMDPLDAPKTTFVTNNRNYHYEVIPFGLKNVGATFQRSMDTIFTKQIGEISKSI